MPTTWPAEIYVYSNNRWVSISPHGMTALAPATGTTIGGVIVGSGINVAPDGTISVTHFSGDYNDLTNKPVIPAPVQSDWLATGGDAFIVNKPNFLSQFTNDLKVSAFPNDALYVDAAAAAAAAPIQSIAAGANVAISDDGHGNIVIAATGGGGGTPGGGVVSVSGTAPIKVVDGTHAPTVSLVIGAGLKVNANALEADFSGLATVATSGSYNDLSDKPTISDASTTTKGIIQIADAANITAGTALRAVDAAGLKAVTDQQTKDFVNVSGDTMTGSLVLPDGTAAAPSLKFDDATGLFQPAANIWAVSTKGVERLRIDSSGNSLMPLGYSACYGSYDYGMGTPDSKGLQIFTKDSDTIRLGTMLSGAFTELARIGPDGKFGINKATALHDDLTICTSASGSANAPVYDGIAWSYGPNRSINLGGIAYVSRFSNLHGGGLRFSLLGEHNAIEEVLLLDNSSQQAQFSIPVVTPTGTAGLPSFAFVGDTDTGTFQPAANTWAVSTAGVERLRVDSSGRVGIGVNPSTFNPSCDDLLVGAGSGGRGITVYGSESGTLAFADADSGTGAYAGYIQYLHATDELRFGTNGTAKLYIDSSGNVGIQRASPTVPLTFPNVIANVGFPSKSEQTNKIRLYDDGSYQFGFGISTRSLNIAANGDNTLFVRFWTDSTERMTISGTGNVGIGTSNPLSLLEVAGQVTADASSAAAVSYGFRGDTDTGTFSPAANTWAVSTGGLERLRVKSTGGVKYVPLATAPATPDEGEVYFDSTTKKLRVYDGTAWADLH